MTGHTICPRGCKRNIGFYVLISASETTYCGGVYRSRFLYTCLEVIRTLLLIILLVLLFLLEFAHA